MNSRFTAHDAVQRIQCRIPRCNSAQIDIPNTYRPYWISHKHRCSTKKNSSISQQTRSSSLQSPILAMAPETPSSDTPSSTNNRTLLCTSLTAPTIQGMLQEAQEALTAQADIVELRLDYLDQFDPETDLPLLLNQCPLPAIVTYRPSWEGYVAIFSVIFICLVVSLITCQ